MSSEASPEGQEPKEPGRIRRAISWCKENPWKAAGVVVGEDAVGLVTGGVGLVAGAVGVGVVAVASAAPGAVLGEAVSLASNMAFYRDVKDRPKKHTVNKAKLKLLLKSNDIDNKAEIIKLIGNIYKDKDQKVSEDLYGQIESYAKQQNLPMQQFGFAEGSKIYDPKIAKVAEAKGTSSIQASEVAARVEAMCKESVSQAPKAPSGGPPAKSKNQSQNI